MVYTIVLASIFGMIITIMSLFYIDRNPPRYHWATKLSVGITYMFWFFIKQDTGKELVESIDSWFKKVLP